jgi:group I intron endonuclease
MQEKKFNFVYLITNLTNGKQYVGDHSTENLEEDKYYLGSGRLLSKKIQEYKKQNFKREILEFFSTKQKAFDAQEQYIIKYNTLVPNGYNISPKGGHNAFGCWNEESKSKMKKSLSISLTGRKFSEEHKKNLSLARKNKTYEEFYGKEKSDIKIK